MFYTTLFTILNIVRLGTMRCSKDMKFVPFRRTVTSVIIRVSFSFRLIVERQKFDFSFPSVKSPPPFKNRDFVTQRCWLDYGQNHDKMIINHSVNHLVGCFSRVECRKRCFFFRSFSANHQRKTMFVEFLI